MKFDPTGRTPVDFADELHEMGCPVIHGPDGEVIVVGHEEAMAIANDPEHFSSAVSAHLQLPNGLDGAEHTSFRSLIDTYLAPSEVERYAESFREVAQKVVAQALKNGSADAVGQLGARYAVRAMMVWLGWPEHLEQRLLDWVMSNIAASRSGDREKIAQVAADFDQIISEVVEPRLKAPESFNDVTTQLVMDEQLGRRLEFPEIVSILRNWTGGDLTSMALCIGVICHGLAHDASLQGWLRSTPEAAEYEAVMDELLRLDNPFVSNRRVTTCPVSIDEVDLPEGQRVYLHWTGANRDPRVFNGSFDPHSHAEDNLVWGSGPHVCPGRSLSMLELRIFFTELLDAAIILRVRGEEQAGERGVHPTGGWRQLPVRLLARQH